MGVDLLNIEGLKELEHQGPIVMVNLMRFRERSLDGDGSGWDAYLRYSALTVPMIKARGGTLLWTGDAKAVALGPQDGNQWDYLALVYYPIRRGVHRHDDVGGLRKPVRPASPQRMRRARHHCDHRGLQQIQDRLARARIRRLADFLRTNAAASHIAFNLPKAIWRGMYFMPQSGAGMSSVRPNVFQALPDSAGNDFGRFDLGISEVEHAEHDLL